MYVLECSQPPWGLYSPQGGCLYIVQAHDMTLFKSYHLMATPCATGLADLGSNEFAVKLAVDMSSVPPSGKDRLRAKNKSLSNGTHTVEVSHYLVLRGCRPHQIASRWILITLP